MRFASSFALSILALLAAPRLHAQVRVTMTLSASRITGSQPVTARLALSAAAPAGGMTVTLSSSATTVAFVDPATFAVVSSIVVPAGQTRRDVTVRTSAVATEVTAQLTAATTAGSSATSLVVMPPSPQAITLAADSTLGGTSVGFTLTLNAPAPAGGISVPVAVSGPGTVAGTVAVGEGQRSATAQVATSPVGLPTIAAVTAAGARDSLRVLPPVVTGVQAPANATGGTPVDVQVTLSGRAPRGGLAVAFTSSVPAIDARGVLTVAEGTTSGRISLPTQSVGSATGAVITATTASGKNATADARLSLLPPAVSQVNVSPARIAGLGSVTMTVTANAPAPVGGLPLTIQRASPVAGVDMQLPTGLVLAAGQRSATFTVPVRAGHTAAGREELGATTAGGSARGTLSIDSLVVTSIAVDRTRAFAGEPITLTITRNGVPVDPAAIASVSARYGAGYCPNGGWWTSCPNSGSFSATYAQGAAPTATATTNAPTVSASAGDAWVSFRSHAAHAELTVTPLRVTGLHVRRTGSTTPVASGDSLASGETVSLAALLNARPATGTSDAYRTRTLRSSMHPNPVATFTFPVGDSVRTIEQVLVPAVAQPTNIHWQTYFTLGESDKTVSHVIRPAPVTLTAASSTVKGGQTVGIGAALGAPPQAIPASGLSYAVEVSNGAAAVTPAPLVFPANTTNGGFALTTLPVTTPTTITVKVGGRPGDFTTGGRVVLTVVP